MEIIKKKLDELNKLEIEQIIRALKDQQIIVILTDTIYGFSCLASSNKAILKLNKIKNRPADKSYILFVSSFNMLKKYSYINSYQKEKIKKFWQEKRPISLVLKSKKKILKGLEKNDSLAFRLPKSQIFIKIIKKLGGPIVSTSFNFSGQELIDINLAESVFKNKKYRPDLIINSKTNKKNKVSRVIDLRDNNIKILRK